MVLNFATTVLTQAWRPFEQLGRGTKISETTRKKMLAKISWLNVVEKLESA